MNIGQAMMMKQGKVIKPLLIWLVCMCMACIYLLCTLRVCLVK